MANILPLGFMTSPCLAFMGTSIPLRYVYPGRGNKLALPFLSLLHAADLCHFRNPPQTANHLCQMMAVAYL
ncbi:hypothetical protein SAMN05216404_12215 [Nitrosospira multiformis]|uniref:Uncharacterized protein n=1 Tax=Nitrosospira multiformis TaxID=1231 RepID=A0A1H8PQ35_9PROT|nr:hypothetical protein SAMN05216404_12215 [Nitrosospira multiformis]